MIKVSEDGYRELLTWVEGMGLSLNLSLVLREMRPGRVYVEKKDQVGCMCILTPDGNYLMGEVRLELLEWLENHQAVLSLNNLSMTEEVYKAFDFVLMDRLVWKRLRYHYQIDLTDQRTPPPSLMDSFEVRPMDRDLLKRCEDQPACDDLIKMIDLYWVTYDDFLDQSLGLVLLHGEQVAGWTWGLFSDKARDQCEVDIEVLPAYRGKGLAYKMSSLFMEYAKTRGFKRLHWDCDDSNVASYKLAEKLGYIKTSEMIFLWMKED